MLIFLKKRVELANNPKTVITVDRGRKESQVAIAISKQSLDTEMRGA
jgi:hypothetical protein